MSSLKMLPYGNNQLFLLYFIKEIFSTLFFKFSPINGTFAPLIGLKPVINIIFISKNKLFCQNQASQLTLL